MDKRRRVVKKRLSKIDNPNWENYLYAQIAEYKLPAPQKEFRFSPERRFRSDFAYPELQILIEVEGGIYMRGRHVTGAGYERDCEKYNLATILDFAVLRFTPNMIKSGMAINTIVQMFYQKGAIDERRYHDYLSQMQARDKPNRGKRGKVSRARPRREGDADNT